MSLCRTCLSKNDLKPIFPDKNLIGLRSKELYDATGIMIRPNDGLPQIICDTCQTLVKFAIKLRNLSAKSDVILKKKIKVDNTVIYNNYISEINKNVSKLSKSEACDNIKQENCLENIEIPHSEGNMNTNKLGIKILNTKSSNNVHDSGLEDIKISHVENLKVDHDIGTNTGHGIRIEDFESSDENSDDIESENLVVMKTDKKITIEDFESSDSCNNDDVNLPKKTTKIISFNPNMKKKSFDMKKWCVPTQNRNTNYENTWLHKPPPRFVSYNPNLEKKLIGKRVYLPRDRNRDMMALHIKLMSLAVTPYDRRGPIKCSICKKELRNIHNFKSHAKTHFEPENTCEVCGKKFVSLYYMWSHEERVHGKTKRLACSKCTYRAVDRQQLENHVRAAHTGERPFICDICGNSFRMRRNILQHMRKHFGIKNIQCERCPSMFRSRSELNNHQSKVHKYIFIYACYLCDEMYKGRKAVRRHIESVHHVPINEQLPLKCTKTRRSEDKGD